LEANAKDRAAKLIRTVPPDRLDIGPNKLWPDYQRKLFKAGVLEAPSAVVSQSFCARGDLAANDALAETNEPANYTAALWMERGVAAGYRTWNDIRSIMMVELSPASLLSQVFASSLDLTLLPTSEYR